jgi:hypothetical protein
VTPHNAAEQIVAARNAIRAIAKSDGVDADSFSMATAAFEAIQGRRLTNDEVEQALDLAFRPEQWS